MVNPIFEWNPIYKDIDDDSESIWFGKTIFSNIPNTDGEVLVTVGEKVDTDTFINNGVDGCFFEHYDINDVKAWAHFPKPYKESKVYEEMFGVTYKKRGIKNGR